MNKKLFYFDLEETVIQSFNDPIFCNENVIEFFIEKNSITEIGIFSAAIINEDHKNYFIVHMLKGIEKRFNIKINQDRIVPMEQVSSLYKNKNGVFVDVWEMLSLYGKDGAFHYYCSNMHKNNITCILLDDAFESITINNHKRRLITKIVNIKELKV